MHLKKAHVLIVLLWKLMCFEAGKFILIPYFTRIIEPSPRRISCLRDGYYMTVRRSVHDIKEFTDPQLT